MPSRFYTDYSGPPGDRTWGVYSGHAPLYKLREAGPFRTKAQATAALREIRILERESGRRNPMSKLRKANGQFRKGHGKVPKKHGRRRR